MLQSTVNRAVNVPKCRGISALHFWRIPFDQISRTICRTMIWQRRIQNKTLTKTLHPTTMSVLFLFGLPFRRG